MNPLHDWIMDRVRPGWRERAAAQDPIWSLLERIVVLALTGFALYFGARSAWFLHVKLRPEDRLHFSNPTSQLPISVFAGCLLTGFLLLCVFGIVVNSIEGLIPWMRRRAETGSDRVPGLTLSAANAGLLKVGIALALLAVPLDIYAIMTPWSGT
jgi:hypothetical protein